MHGIHFLYIYAHARVDDLDRDMQGHSGSTDEGQKSALNSLDNYAKQNVFWCFWLWEAAPARLSEGLYQRTYNIIYKVFASINTSTEC